MPIAFCVSPTFFSCLRRGKRPLRPLGPLPVSTGFVSWFLLSPPPADPLVFPRPLLRRAGSQLYRPISRPQPLPISILLPFQTPSKPLSGLPPQFAAPYFFFSIQAVILDRTASFFFYLRFFFPFSKVSVRFFFLPWCTQQRLYTGPTPTSFFFFSPCITCPSTFPCAPPPTKRPLCQRAKPNPFPAHLGKKRPLITRIRPLFFFQMGELKRPIPTGKERQGFGVATKPNPPQTPAQKTKHQKKKKTKTNNNPHPDIPQKHHPKTPTPPTPQKTNSI